MPSKKPHVKLLTPEMHKLAKGMSPVERSSAKIFEMLTHPELYGNEIIPVLAKQWGLSARRVARLRDTLVGLEEPQGRRKSGGMAPKRKAELLTSRQAMAVVKEVIKPIKQMVRQSKSGKEMANVGRSPRPRTQAKARRARQERDESERQINDLLAGKERVEAISWLKGSNRNSKRNLAEWTIDESIQLVEQLYNCGAEEVWAVRFDRNPPYESINTLIVTLPAATRKRRAVFGCANQQIVRQGFDPEDDDGQRHLYIWFD